MTVEVRRAPTTQTQGKLGLRILRSTLDNFEDAFLLAGALLIAAGTVLTSSNSLVFGGVLLAALGKAAPSLATETWDATTPRRSNETASAALSRRQSDRVVLVGDAVLAAAAIAGAVLHYLHAWSVFQVVELILIGFIVKGAFGIAGDGEWLVGHPTDDLNPEDVLLIALGVTSLVILVLAKDQFTAPSGVALLAAFWAKAFPSIPKASTPPDGGASGSEFALDLQFASR